jgi:hypothetical protein
VRRGAVASAETETETEVKTGCCRRDGDKWQRQWQWQSRTAEGGVVAVTAGQDRVDPNEGQGASGSAWSGWPISFQDARVGEDDDCGPPCRGKVQQTGEERGKRKEGRAEQSRGAWAGALGGTHKARFPGVARRAGASGCLLRLRVAVAQVGCEAKGRWGQARRTAAAGGYSNHGHHTARAANTARKTAAQQAAGGKRQTADGRQHAANGDAQ